MQFILEKYNAKGTVLSFKTVKTHLHETKLPQNDMECICYSLTKFSSG